MLQLFSMSIESHGTSELHAPSSRSLESIFQRRDSASTSSTRIHVLFCEYSGMNRNPTQWCHREANSFMKRSSVKHKGRVVLTPTRHPIFKQGVSNLINGQRILT